VERPRLAHNWRTSGARNASLEPYKEGRGILDAHAALRQFLAA
jgi:hypothetical protein